MALLTLVAFSVTADEPAGLLLTFKGAANLIPKNIPSDKGPKGQRVVKLSTGDTDPIFAVGEVTKINGAIEVADDDADYLTWFKDNFVPKGNGGGLVAEDSDEEPSDDEAPDEDSDEDSDADADEGSDEDSAADNEPPAASTLEAKLEGMLANEVKKYAKDLGVTPGTSKSATIAAIMAHENRHEHALASAEEAKAFVTANSTNRAELDALRQKEADGKARKGVLKHIAEALTALDKAEAAEAATKDPPVDEDAGEATTDTNNSGLDDATKAKASEYVQGIAGPIGEMVTLLGRKRTQTILRRLVGATDDGGQVNLDVAFGSGGSDGERKSPICHVVGAVHTTTRKHRDERGVCEYTIECTAGGSYKLIGLTGNRKDIKVGDTFKHGLELIQKLTGRETGIPTVARWFGLI
jgi:hypothetical protein